MTPNILEDAIIDGVRRAVEQYSVMSGASLCHAPESFLQMKIVDSIFSKGKYWVYPDISIGRIHEEVHGSRDDIDQCIKSKRPDISVWYKKTLKIRALIEIKRTWYATPILEDIRKLREIIEKSKFVKCGYVVGYWEFNGKNIDADSKFSDWESQSNTKLIAKPSGDFEDNIFFRNGHFRTWAAAILRVDS
jgi:hypothetical protein